MSSFPQWMAVVAQAFSQWIESWMVQDYPAFRERPRMVSAQSWATLRGTMVLSPDGRCDPWLQVFTDHPAAGSIMGCPREVLPAFRQPMCNLPILAVATMLDVGAMWLYDRQLRRVIPATTWQLSMAVLVGSKQLARIQGHNFHDAQGHITEVLISLPEERGCRRPSHVRCLGPRGGRRGSVGRTAHGNCIRQGRKTGRD